MIAHDPDITKKRRWSEENLRPGMFDNSPFPSHDGPLPPNGPRMPKPFPPADWAAKMRSYARGDKSSLVLVSDEEKQVKTDRSKFAKALATTDVDKRAASLGDALMVQLGSKYKGSTAKRGKGDEPHPAEVRIQRALVSLEALLAAGKGFQGPDERKVLLRAMHRLTPEQQTDLLRADEATGRRLYSALYLAGKDDPHLKDSFDNVKGAAHRARVESQLDSHDPSGETSAVVNRVLGHLDQAGMSKQERNAFLDKLNFKLSIGCMQADLPLPDTSQKGWREKFTARTLSVFAETPAVSDESIERALQLPEPELVKVLGHAYMGTKDDDPRNNPDMVRREGDMRLARVARSQAAKNKNDHLRVLLEGLDSNYLDRRLLLEEAKRGTPVKDILKVLETEAAQYAAKLADQGKQKFEARRKSLPGLQSEVDEQIRNANDLIKKALLNPQPDQGELEALRNDQKVFGQRKVKLEQARAILQDGPPSSKQILSLLKRFGRFASGLNELNYDPNFTPTALSLAALPDTFQQVRIQVAAVENPALLKEGLNRSSYVLPTAGKPLKNCPWLRSTAEDLVRIATDIRDVDRHFTLENNPIIVLDQTDGNGANEAKTGLWKENGEFVKKLEAEYKDFGLTIKHISMGNINRVIQGSGIEKLFDTTGEGNAGYGGARNMAYLLGPVIQHAVRNGEDPNDIKPAELARRIKASALTKAPKLFMGDDTDYVAPGGVASKAALAASKRHADEYSLITTPRCGRDTMGVSSLAANGACKGLVPSKENRSPSLETLTATLFQNNSWNANPKTPGMGCTFGEPRFCLDLPTGAEEKQCDCSVPTKDLFGQASHLSGDRQTAPSVFLKSFMIYSNSTEMVKGLMNEMELPWNAEAAKRKRERAEPFGSLGEVMSEAADPEKRKEMQKSMLTRFVGWHERNGEGGGPLQLDGNQADEVQAYLDQHPEIDAETRDEITKIKGVYEYGKQQAQLMKEFISRLLAELKLPAKASPEDLEAAIGANLHDPAGVQKAIKKVREAMGEKQFSADNPMLRDLALILDSVAGGGFSHLCDTLVNAR